MDTPKQQGAGDVRQRIFDGAARAFAKRGLSQTSVEDILGAAEVSRRTFYRFFANKQELFEQLFDRKFQQLLGAASYVARQHNKPLAKLTVAIDAILRELATSGPLAKVLIMESFQPGSGLAQKREAVVSSFVDLMSNEASQLGRTAADPLLLRALLAGLEQVAWELQIQAEQKGEADWDRGKRVMLRLLASALAEPGDPVPPLPER